MIYLVAGARPNFMKIAPIAKEMDKVHLNYKVIHTGQHYDDEMSKAFFNDLGLSEPDIYLGVGSGNHGEQTAKIMIEFEKVCLEKTPDLVVVVGDVNSTIACALVASKICIPIAHVEAGLRSFDRTMPEEINRLLTDQLSDYLFTTCEDANQNLIKEGIPENKIFFVGNVMIDTLLRHIKFTESSNIIERLGFKEKSSIKKYTLVTLHRPSNVDTPVALKGILDVLNKLSQVIPVIFPVHPRTLKKIRNFQLTGMLHYVENISTDELNEFNQGIFAIPPLGYLDFLCLLSNAALVLTDSGGIQEETTILGIPCLTLRNNTERPITVREGTNTVVGNRPDKILNAAFDVLKNGISRRKIPKCWDGRAAERIARILAGRL